MAETKKDALRRAFLRGERLTPLLALQRYRCLSLSQRVGGFKKEGIAIESEFVKGQPYKVYYVRQQLALELAA